MTDAVKMAIEARIAEHPMPRNDEEQQYVWGLEFALAALEQADPQSRGQAFDGEGEELAEAVRSIMARCEALEDEASNGIATTSANVRDDTHEAGFWRGQKSTAKSIREHLHDMTRAALSSAKRD